MPKDSETTAIAFLPNIIDKLFLDSNNPSMLFPLLPWAIIDSYLNLKGENQKLIPLAKNLYWSSEPDAEQKLTLNWLFKKERLKRQASLWRLKSSGYLSNEAGNPYLSCALSKAFGKKHGNYNRDYDRKDASESMGKNVHLLRNASDDLKADQEIVLSARGLLLLESTEELFTLFSLL